jgi:hypothetical protein
MPGPKYPTFRADVNEITFSMNVVGAVYMAGVHVFNFTEVRLDDLKASIELGVETDSKGNLSYW